MTKKINNNEIETFEENYTEGVNEEQVEVKSKKRFLKPIIFSVAALAVLGGTGAYAYNKYETNQRAKIQEAYSNVKIDVTVPAINENGEQTTTTVSIKTQDEIKKIVAETIAVDESSINFIEIKPEFGRKHHSDKKMRQYQNQNTQNQTPAEYIYEVEARANGLEYDLDINAITGEVLKVKIDN